MALRVVIGLERPSGAALGPEGAAGCSHGCSAAQPVEEGPPYFLLAPEGRRTLDARHILPTPAPRRLFDQGPRAVDQRRSRRAVVPVHRRYRACGEGSAV